MLEIVLLTDSHSLSHSTNIQMNMDIYNNVTIAVKTTRYKESQETMKVTLNLLKTKNYCTRFFFLEGMRDCVPSLFSLDIGVFIT